MSTTAPQTHMLAGAKRTVRLAIGDTVILTQPHGAWPPGTAGAVVTIAGGMITFAPSANPMASFPTEARLVKHG